MTAWYFQTETLGLGQAAWEEGLAGVPAVALVGTCSPGRSGPAGAVRLGCLHRKLPDSPGKVGGTRQAELCPCCCGVGSS